VDSNGGVSATEGGWAGAVTAVRRFATSKGILIRLLAATAILLLTFAGSVCAQGPPPLANQAAVAAATDRLVELARALAWPFAAIFVACLLLYHLLLSAAHAGDTRIG